MRSKGLARLVFLIVFLIPVGWYLILQLFGDNTFALEKLEDIDASCGTYNRITLVVTSDTLSTVQKNYFERVKYGADKRSIQIEHREAAFFDCINQSGKDVVLLGGSGIWGAYELSRKGVDVLLTEMDILLLQQSYGKGTSR